MKTKEINKILWTWERLDLATPLKIEMLKSLDRFKASHSLDKMLKQLKEFGIEDIYLTLKDFWLWNIEKALK